MQIISMNPQLSPIQPENIQHPLEPLQEARLMQAQQLGEETNGLLEAIIQQGENNNPEPLLEAQIVQAKENTNRIVEALQPTAQATSKMASFLEEMKGEKGDKGDKGDTGEKGEKGDSIRGEKGEQGIQGERGDAGIDGLNGRDGKDGIDGKDGRDGKDGDTPKIDYKKVIKEAVKQIPVIDIDEKVKEIVEKVSINTNDTLQSIRSQKQASQSVSMGDLTDVKNATVGQIMVKQADGTWAPADQSGGAGGSVTVATPTGSVNGTNVTFTNANVAKWIDTDTGHYYENFGYTRSGTTYTMDLAPNTYIRLVY